VGGYYENPSGENHGSVSRDIKCIPNTSPRYGPPPVIPRSPPVPRNSGTPRGGVPLYRRRRELDEMIKEGGLGDVYAAA